MQMYGFYVGFLRFQLRLDDGTSNVYYTCTRRRPNRIRILTRELVRIVFDLGEQFQQQKPMSGGSKVWTTWQIDLELKLDLMQRLVRQ